MSSTAPEDTLAPAARSTNIAWSPDADEVFGTHNIKVAVAWQHASAGDWTTYAADYSHRKPTTTEDPEPVTQTRG